MTQNVFPPIPRGEPSSERFVLWDNLQIICREKFVLWYNLRNISILGLEVVWEYCFLFVPFCKPPPIASWPGGFRVWQPWRAGLAKKVMSPIMNGRGSRCLSNRLNVSGRTSYRSVWSLQGGPKSSCIRRGFRYGMMAYLLPQHTFGWQLATSGPEQNKAPAIGC